jgi:hypothetical protein
LGSDPNCFEECVGFFCRSAPCARWFAKACATPIAHGVGSWGNLTDVDENHLQWKAWVIRLFAFWGDKEEMDPGSSPGVTGRGFAGGDG